MDSFANVLVYVVVSFCIVLGLFTYVNVLRSKDESSRKVLLKIFYILMVGVIVPVVPKAITASIQQYQINLEIQKEENRNNIKIEEAMHQREQKLNEYLEDLIGKPFPVQLQLAFLHSKLSHPEYRARWHSLYVEYQEEMDKMKENYDKRQALAIAISSKDSLSAADLAVLSTNIALEDPGIDTIIKIGEANGSNVGELVTDWNNEKILELEATMKATQAITDVGVGIITQSPTTGWTPIQPHKK